MITLSDGGRMPVAEAGRRRISGSVSLRPVDVMALRYLAGLDSSNASAAARKLIAARMTDLLGADWESHLLSASELNEVAS